MAQSAPANSSAPEGVGGWLLVYVVGRVALLPHQLQLTIGALIIFADPGAAGRRTFVSLGSLLFYEATNWLLVGLTVLALILIHRRSRAAIPVNLALGGLWLAALIAWQFLGLKSSIGMTIDAIPALFGVWYFLTSKRVRNTFNQTGGRATKARTS